MMNEKHTKTRKGWLALLPLLLLLLLMAVSVFGSNFDNPLPMTVVFSLVAIFAIATLRGFSFDHRIRIFSSGAGAQDLLLMVWIFILAGAFAQGAREAGAVDAMVDLCLRFIPAEFILVGLFLSACLVSLCVGTSVGTIAAIVPVAIEMSDRTGGVLPMFVGAVVGGAFFGDNLSFISDTTVAATKTQGCMMTDKFRANSRLAIPAAIFTLLVYFFFGAHTVFSADSVTGIVPTGHAAGHILTIPYFAVLIAAVFGANVLLVLPLGILLTGIVGLSCGTLTWTSWMVASGKGISSMGDLILVSMLAGGCLAVVRAGGGLTWLVRGLTKRVKTRRQAECAISALVSATNLCTANNTIAILSVGEIVRTIARRYKITSRRSASLLDVFSCVVQGLIPYGAQLLMAAGLAALNPLHIIPYIYYPIVLGFITIVSILFAKSAKSEEM